MSETTNVSRSVPPSPAPRASARSRRSGCAAEADTKPTQLTTNHLVAVIFVAFVIFVAEPVPSAVSRWGTPQQQAPVFRVGTYLVTVDAYPTQGGRVIPGLTPDDFEVFEDGTPQKVAAVELIDYDAPLPDDDRPVRLSADEGLRLAADPKYRVIVFVIDRQAFDRDTWPPMRDALIEYLHTTVEPRDLVALLTTDDPWQAVLFGQRPGAIEEELSNPEWLRTPYREDALVMAGCGMEGMLGRVRADTTFTMLEGLVRVLGQVREDHSSIVFVSNELPRVAKDLRTDDSRPLALPRTGLVNGRIQRIGPDMHQQYCTRERQRLKDIDFERRFDDLTKTARASNIAFYPIGVWNPNPVIPIELRARGARGIPRPPAAMVDSLIALARETSGFIVPPLGDVRKGLSRIAGDVGSHYLLGYYTTNTAADGKTRSIRVRLKRTGAEIRARSEYRAPGAEDVAALSAPRQPGPKIVAAPVALALSTLARERPSAQFHTYGAVAGRTLYVTIETPPVAVAAGRWRDGAAVDVIAETRDGASAGMAHGRLGANGRASLQVPLDGAAAPATLFVRVSAEGESIAERVQVGANRSVLVGDPLAFRSSGRGLAIPVASFVFARDERLRLEWPVLGSVDRYQARLLDRYGLPLEFKIAVDEQPVLDGRRLIATVALAPLGRGDYVIELTATAGGDTERHFLAFRVN